MKVFIVFLALLLINVSFLAFHTDMDQYQRLQVYLKAAAEEGAAGGALYQDEESYGQGLLVIDEQEAREYIAYQMGRTEKELSSIGGKVSWEAEIFDDEKGYEGCFAYGLDEGIPGIRLSVQVKCGDLFRLPFLTVCTVKRSAVYQWENRFQQAGA